MVADLGTEAQVSWTSGPAPGNPECIIWDIQDGCSIACASIPGADSCGTATIDGVVATLNCDPTDDLCHGPELVGVVPEVPLSPGDEITVILFPTPGAAPESDTSDDSRTIVFGPTAVEPESFGRIKGGYR